MGEGEEAEGGFNLGKRPLFSPLFFFAPPSFPPTTSCLLIKEKNFDQIFIFPPPPPLLSLPASSSFEFRPCQHTQHTQPVLFTGRRKRMPLLFSGKTIQRRRRRGKGRPSEAKTEKRRPKLFSLSSSSPLLPFFSRRNSLSTFHQRKNGGKEEEGGREGGDADMKNTKSGKGRGGQISKTESPSFHPPMSLAFFPKRLKKLFWDEGKKEEEKEKAMFDVRRGDTKMGRRGNRQYFRLCPKHLR